MTDTFTAVLTQQPQALSASIFTSGGGTGVTMYHEEFLPGSTTTTVTLGHVPEAVLIVARAGVVQSMASGHYSVAGSVVTVASAFNGTERVIVSYSVRP